MFGEEVREFHFENEFAVLVKMPECRWPLAVGASWVWSLGKSRLETQVGERAMSAVIGDLDEA